MKKSFFATIAVAIVAGLAALFRPLGEMLNKGVESHMARHGMMAFAITSESKNMVNANRFTYAHLDDAASPAAITQYPGFKPSRVVLVNVTDRITYEWMLGMNEGDYFKTVAAGTRTLETDDLLVVERDSGARPSITVAASIVLQNKRYFLEATG